MDSWWIVLATLAFAALFFGKPLWASVTSPKADLIQIKVEYEGVTSKAGPYTKVSSIVRSGIDWGGRYSPPYRKYTVQLMHQNGVTAERIVGVEATFLGGGETAEYRNGLRNPRQY